MWPAWRAGRAWGLELQCKVRTAERAGAPEHWRRAGEEGRESRAVGAEEGSGGGRRCQRGQHPRGRGLLVHTCAQAPSWVQGHNGDHTQAGALPSC